MSWKQLAMTTFKKRDPPPPKKKAQKKFNFKHKKNNNKTIKPTFLQCISRNEIKVKEYEQIEITFKSYV